MPTSDRKLRVFLCHASQDKSTVRELYQRLTIEGWIDPWLDEEKLIPGIHWGMQIEKAMESTDAVIMCLSNHSVTKEGYVQKEMREALEYSLYKPEDTIFIIPLRLDACSIPWNIKSIQYIDYFPLDRVESSYKKILFSLEARATLLGIDIEEIREHSQKEAEEKTQRELVERIRKEERAKARYEEEKILRQDAQERARLEINEEISKLVKEGKREAAKEKERQEKELIRKKAEELFNRDKELLRHKREESSQTNYPYVGTYEPHKNNNGMIIYIVSVMVLCACCAVVAGGWLYGDAIMQALGG